MKGGQRKLLANLAHEPLDTKMAAARTSGNEMHAPKPAKLNMLTDSKVHCNLDFPDVEHAQHPLT